MRQAQVTDVWWLFFAIFILSAPLIFVGWRSDVRLLPGLPLSALMVVSIAAAAALIAYRLEGPAGIRELFGAVVDVRSTSPWWYLVSALLMPLVLFLEYRLMKALARGVPSPDVTWVKTLPLVALFLVAAALEEVAWTGVALEPLRTKWGGLVAAIGIGIVWAVLHSVPYVQVRPLSWAAGQFVFSVLFRVVLVWLFVSTHGSLLTVVICHAAYNTAWQLFPVDGSAYDPWLAAMLTGALAVVLSLASGLRMLAPGS